MSTDQLRQFFAHIARDPSFKQQVLQAVSADAAALIAQQLGYEVSGDELLRFSGKSSSGVSVTKIQHPGEYHLKQARGHHRDQLVQLRPSDPSLRELVNRVEQEQPADLSIARGVWELRWSSSQQPWLKQTAGLENLQALDPDASAAAICCGCVPPSPPWGASACRLS